MTLIKTTYLGDLRTEAVHLDSGSKINTSAPKDNNGDGLLFSPTDLFATSLGCCMLTIIGMTAKTHGFSIDGTTIHTEKVMAANPRRIAELILDVEFPKNNYSPKEKAIIENAAKTCPVANSLDPAIKKTINFIY
ncbi:MAG: OsmC family protein [Bacteroidales bacterium]|nr:OsmC family protein [Bacteroidales bacterium]MDD4669806.1 OsmC family protein [Bacteroidales bacterium]